MPAHFCITTGRTRASIAVFLLLCCFYAGCASAPQDNQAQAYVAPASVNLRPQLNQKGSSGTILHFAEPVSIIDARRRYVKVRARNGAEGWVDSLDLLSPGEMNRIKQEREHALQLPSEGTATAYETLNIHLDPNRKSPAFAQIGEGTPVSILARKATPKLSDAVRPSFALERPKPPARKQRKEHAAKAGLRTPPMPPPPKPPENWEHLLGGNADESEAPEQSPAQAKPATPPRGKPASPPKPVTLEDWNLIRTKNDQIGWVLSRNLMMSIPDDVAQYAGGKHITSFFDLGTVNDERDGAKHNWLWTTASGGQSFDFDSWRVFLWNRRRHRYETSYRQHDLEGYFPVRVDTPDSNTAGRTFHLITQDDDGKLRSRAYLFDGTLVHLTGTEDYSRNGSKQATGAQDLNANSALSKTTQENWLQRNWQSWKQMLSSKH